MVIVTSRGCPYSCIYCPVTTTIGRKLRVRSPENVVDEIEFWYRRGYWRFLIADDNFTFYKDRVYGICDQVNRRGLRIQLNCHNGVRADRVDRALLERMRASGFQGIAFGVEAGTDRVLRTIKKGEHLKDITRAIQDACELGFDVALFFLIGSPGETPQDLEESFKIARTYNISDVRFYNLVPFPGTELYQWVSENNYLLRTPEEYLNGGMQWVNKPIFETPTLSTKQRKAAFRRGLAIGRRVRAKWYFKYYKDCFRKLGLLAPLVAFFASRSLVREYLPGFRVFRYVRDFVKRHGLFAPRLQSAGTAR
jgi:radical SAM superfamily enzyme YgiQ (UPF0313 family)